MASVRWKHGEPVKGLGLNSDCLPCSAAFAPAALKPKLVIAFSKLLMAILASMHDSLTFLARTIQTGDSPLSAFGTFGIPPLASIPIGRDKSLTMATSSGA